jgi:hypothetical protein
METDDGHPDVTSSRPVGQVLSLFEKELNLYHRAPQLPKKVYQGPSITNLLFTSEVHLE